jgi:hypothetical protein
MSDNSAKCFSFPVNGDQSGNIYKFVKMNTSGQVLLNDSAGGYCTGVLYSSDGSATGKVVPVAVDGIVKVLAGATVAMGAQVASTNAGLATTASGAVYSQGQCVKGGDSGDIIEILRIVQSQNNA